MGSVRVKCEVPFITQSLIYFWFTAVRGLGDSTHFLAHFSGSNYVAPNRGVARNLFWEGINFDQSALSQ